MARPIPRGNERGEESLRERICTALRKRMTWSASGDMRARVSASLPGGPKPSLVSILNERRMTLFVREPYFTLETG